MVRSDENKGVRTILTPQLRNSGERSDRLVIIVPYRDRLDHLKVFVSHMESFLKDQAFRILIVEQADNKPFNKGKLCNVGFTLTLTEDKWICFHDVDMLPADDSCDYSLSDHTIHLAGCVEQFGFRIPYPEYIGGVLLTMREEFERVNGYSNEYWGWGNEDDDLYIRYQLSGSPIQRKPGRYLSLPHPTSQASLENDARLARALAFAASQTTDSRMLEQIKHIQTDFSPVPVESAADYSVDGLCNLRYRILSRRCLQGITNFAHAISDIHEIVSVEV